MGNKYYTARDDGETWGPFDSSDEALLHCIVQLAEDPDAVLPEYNRPAVELMEWHNLMVERGWFFPDSPSLQYGDWVRNAKRLVQSVDWIVYGVEFIVDAPDGQVQGVLNFLSGPELLHDPVLAFGDSNPMAN